MRTSKPFGLKEQDLSPGRIVADPIHGDVHLTRLEIEVIDSVPFQRLRRVRQLGSTHLVYPGATHTRFSHSLGAVRAVQKLLDHAFGQRDGIHPVPDLLEEWKNEEPKLFQERLAKATVVARLGALLHDFCHLPFGHSIEDDLKLLKSHDENEWRLKHLWGEFDEELASKLEQDGLATAVKAIIAPGLKFKKRSEYLKENPFVADLVGNTICADLIDYLARDHEATGLPMALGDRFLTAFFITPSGQNGLFEKRMALNLMRKGHERADIATELLKYLRYRYELTERVLTHHAKLRADAMVGVLIDLYERIVSAEISASGKKPKRKRVRKRLESQLLMRGDDGLLEDLAYAKSDEEPEYERKAISSLADALLNRELFVECATYPDDFAIASQLEDRKKKLPMRDVAREAARFAEVEDWKVALWVPPAKMNLKAAKVLVSDGTTVSPFTDYEISHGGHRGADLETLHQSLWCARVFVHKSLSKESREEIRVYIASRLGIPWEGTPLDYGQNTFLWPDALALERVMALDEFRRLVREEVRQAHEFSLERRGSAPETFRGLLGSLKGDAEGVRMIAIKDGRLEPSGDDHQNST